MVVDDMKFCKDCFYCVEDDNRTDYYCLYYAEAKRDYVTGEWYGDVPWIRCEKTRSATSTHGWYGANCRNRASHFKPKQKSEKVQRVEAILESGGK